MTDFAPPITVVVPAYNEAEGIGPQIEDLRDALRTWPSDYEILVVDDGSSDATAARAMAMGARVLRHPCNRGYGASLKTGIIAARHEVIVIIDADRTYPADQIPGLVRQLASADMVVGARIGANVNIPLARRPAKWMLGQIANVVSGQRIPDLNSGLRAFYRDCVRQYFPVLSNRFSFTTTVTLALLADDYRVLYQPIDYYPRVGQSKITPRHFMDFVILVLRMAMLFQPLKLFAPLSLVIGALGLLKALFDVSAVFVRHPGVGWGLLFEPVLSTSAMLLLTTALQLLLIGMVADGVVRRIAQHNGSAVASRAVTAVEDYPVIAPNGIPALVDSSIEVNDVRTLWPATPQS